MCLVTCPSCFSIRLRENDFSRMECLHLNFPVPKVPKNSQRKWRQRLKISSLRSCFVENGKEMYQNDKRTCTGIKPVVLCPALSLPLSSWVIKLRQWEKKMHNQSIFGRSLCVAVLFRCSTFVLDVAFGHLGYGTWFLELNFSFVCTCDHEWRQGTTSLFRRYHVICNQIFIFTTGSPSSLWELHVVQYYVMSKWRWT